MIRRYPLAATAICTAMMAAITGGNAAASEPRPAGLPRLAEITWGDFSLSTGLHYSTGKYGQDQATDIVYAPVTAKLERDGWTAKLTVPYVSITGPGNVVQGVGVVGGQTLQHTTQSGLGDVVASLGRTVYENGATAVDVVGKVKFGTADAGKGLGTGKNDYALAVEPAHNLGPATLFGTLGYKVMGDPDGQDLNNVVFASAGVAAPLAESVTAGFSLDTQSRSSASSPGAQWDLTAFASHRLNRSWQGQAYVSRGLSDASADWAGGLTASYRF